LNHTITSEDIITLAARLEMQADAWDADGSSAKLQAYVKANPSAFTGAPSTETVSRIHDTMVGQGWQGTRAQLEDLYAKQTQANRVDAYNLLAGEGTHGALYRAAAQLRSLSKFYSSAIQGSRLVRVSAIEEQCAQYQAVVSTIELLTAIYTIAAVATIFGCVPCAGVASAGALLVAILDFVGLGMCG
jgi:hypothetical protein